MFQIDLEKYQILI